MFCCSHCSKLSKTLNNIVESELVVTMLNDIVDNSEQCGQKNFVQSDVFVNLEQVTFFAV